MIHSQKQYLEWNTDTKPDALDTKVLAPIEQTILGNYRQLLKEKQSAKGENLKTIPDYHESMIP